MDRLTAGLERDNPDGEPDKEEITVWVCPKCGANYGPGDAHRNANCGDCLFDRTEIVKLQPKQVRKGDA